MKALKLSVAAILLASSFGVYAAQAPADTQGQTPVTPSVATQANTAPVSNTTAPKNVVVIDGKEYYCPRGFDVSDCPRLNGERPVNPRFNGVPPHHRMGPGMGQGQGQGMGPGRGQGQGMGPGPNMRQVGPMGPQTPVTMLPRPGMGPVAYVVNADHFAPGPHHTAHLRPNRGPGMGKVMNTYCPHHNTLLADCLGDELDNTFKADFGNLQALKDQLFIKRQILKARVADGDTASAITKYSKDVITAKREYRKARYELDVKIRNYVQAHFDKGLEQK